MEQIALRDISGHSHECTLSFSGDLPLQLQLQLQLQPQVQLRLQLDAEQLRQELSQWATGAKVRKPVLQLTDRNFTAMKRWYVASKPPKPRHLAMWALSRCSLSSQPWDIRFGDEARRNEESSECSRSTGTVGVDNDNDVGVSDIEYTDSDCGAENLSDDDPPAYTEASPLEEDDIDDPPSYSAALDIFDTEHNRPDTCSYSPLRSAAGMSSRNLAASTLPRKCVRKDATKTVVKDGWSDNKHHLNRALKHSVLQLHLRAEEQRRQAAVTKTRNQQAADRLLREKAKQQKALEERQWEQRATLEELQLQEVVSTVEEDLRRQKCKAQKQVERIAWTIQPFRERRGRSVPGVYLGPGPLPAAATAGLAQTAEREVTKNYYWDTHGRRHRRQFGEEFSSAVEEALEILKRAAEADIVHELDLHKVVRQFDTDGDGLLNLEEFGRSILATGLKISVEQLAALFKHFDRDGNGQVTTGEFVWAFFNRRKLVREWQRASQDMSTGQILALFHRVDENGNGKLSSMELAKALRHFDIECDHQEASAIVGRFDLSGDGQLDIHEFVTYLKGEQS